MGKTKIEWARNADGSQGQTWNPLRAKVIDGTSNVSKAGHFGTGCTMVSPGCLNCYAGTINRRFYGNDYSYQTKPTEFYLDERILEAPLRTRKPTTFFVCSMCDLFHENVPNELIAEIFGVMAMCEQHTFQVLTKRQERMKLWFDWIASQWPQLFMDHQIPEDYPIDANVVLQFVSHLPTRSLLEVCKDVAPQDWPLPNVWTGVSAENQETADLRIPILLQIPAAIRWVSLEPLLGPIFLGKCGAVEIYRPGYKTGEPVNLVTDPNFPQIKARGLIDWAVVGGESGPKARPMHPEWARSLRDQCVDANIPLFFKQWGAWEPVADIYSQDKYESRLSTALEHRCINLDKTGCEWPEFQPPGGTWIMERVGKKHAGRKLDDTEWNQMPNKFTNKEVPR